MFKRVAGQRGNRPGVQCGRHRFGRSSKNWRAGPCCPPLLYPEAGMSRGLLPLDRTTPRRAPRTLPRRPPGLHDHLDFDHDNRHLDDLRPDRHGFSRHHVHLPPQEKGRERRGRWWRRGGGGSGNSGTNNNPPYTPAQIRQAYNVNQVLLPNGQAATGAGQTIAIVDAYNDPNIASDLNTFDSKFSLPPASLTVHQMTSGIQTNSSWAIETSLDVEWSHAIAPGRTSFSSRRPRAVTPTCSTPSPMPAASPGWWPCP